MRALSLSAWAAASIALLSGVGSAADSPSGKIVYDLGDRIVISGIDGTNRRLLVRTPPAPVTSVPVWSPDGSRIAFSRAGAVFVVTANEGQLTRVANLRPSVGSLRWSPDGTRIAFSWATRGSCAQPGRSDVGLFVVDADGSDLREVVDVKKTRVPPHVARFFDVLEWSPNGKRVLYRDDRYEEGECRGGFGRGSFLRHTAVAGGRPTSLSGSLQARWSPNGSLLALDGPRGCALFVARPDGRARRLLLPDNRNQACFDDGWVAWSLNGNELYVARWDAVLAVRVSDRRRRTLLGDEGLCSDRDFQCTNGILALAVDGERLLVEAEGSEDPILVLLSTDGRRKQRLPHPGLVPFAAFLD